MKLRRLLSGLLMLLAVSHIVFALVMTVSAKHWWQELVVYVVFAIVIIVELAGSLLFAMEAEALA